MHDLRSRVANEIYNVGESLFLVVDADFRETLKPGSKKNNKNPVTDIERWQFKKVLHKTCHGTLRWLLLIYLRTYDSLEELVRKKEEGGYSVPGQFRNNTRKGSGRNSPNRERSQSPVAFGVRSNSTVPGVSNNLSLNNNNPNKYKPDPTPADILKQRMNSLLDDVKGSWERERRDPRRAGAGSLLHDELEEELGFNPSGSSNSLPFHRTQRRKMLWEEKEKDNDIVERGGSGKRQTENERRTKLNFLDSGAGPREYWSTVSPSLDGGGGGDDLGEGEVEQHLWRLVLLIRCQDRGRGLRLQRHEPQRKLLDLRVYELVLHYMRITLLKEKSVSVVSSVGGGGFKLKFLDVGKWSGKSFTAEDAPNRKGGSGPGGNFHSKSLDPKHFARLTKEFERVKRDRMESTSKGRREVAGKRAASREDVRTTAKEGGAILNPMGHSIALGGLKEIHRGGGYAKVNRIGDGMYDVGNDRRDTFF